MPLNFPRFERARVLVAGDIMLDRYWHGPTMRISPEAPVPVVRITDCHDRPGGAANVALNIAALGAATSVVGAVGCDDQATILCDQLAAAGIHAALLECPAKPTITKLRVISRQHQLLRLDFEEPHSAAEVAALPARVQGLLPDHGVLVLSDYAKGALQDPQALIALATAAGVPVLVDPKGRDFSRYAGATLLTPNLAELEAVVGPCPDEAALGTHGLALVRELGLGALLVTRGEQGMTLLRPGHDALHLPARAREVYDVTGAGDTVIAVLAAALAAGAELSAAVTLANLAAGIVVGKLGTAAVSEPELRRALQQERGVARGVVNHEQLLAEVADARARGEKIVFTNGCFDLLHAGHVRYLEQARQLGDRLIVAVNDDASVRRLKGEGRPLNPVERRMAVLAGLESVDWVTSFAEDTPEALLGQVRPDVLAKGGDYDREQVVGWRIVENYGGEVRPLGLLDGCSTTAIVEKIRTRPSDPHR
ncbi:MAG: bifunctional D-glycero-beta-D-manno-heptose-7-phosphate kinase/D-glycero-beta-D-manno-heptose 1-phosphate adenylyltransferase HldE [Porticoccaceae bacterium]